jgi:selenocysteine lyase/cysteine desulfurase
MAAQGLGLCYVRPDLLDAILPPLIGARSLEAGAVLFRPGAARFEESAISWLNIAVLKAGVDMIAELSIAAIEARVLASSRRLGAGLAALGCQVAEPWPRRADESSRIVAFRPRLAPASVLAALAGSGIGARAHDHVVRFSAHAYNTEHEIDRALGVLAAAIPA